MPVVFRNAGNTIASGFSITQFSAQHVGALIHRDAANTGTGNCTLTGIQLGVEDLPVFNAEMKAFALEMVNVPALGAASFVWATVLEARVAIIPCFLQLRPRASIMPILIPAIGHSSARFRIAPSMDIALNWMAFILKG
ncbi:MAG: hypothetical protein HWD58_09450 [Bacteroidota bacterium]|nr:MAG: hypothetical protein HWD58_09450 [Bacteroidota bacterium]